MSTLFTPILQRTVDRVPGAVGCIFADWDGEAVDQVATLSKEEIQLLGAHYGIILNQINAALHTFHYGSANEVIVQHERMDFLVHVVARGYYLVLVAPAGLHLGTARREVAAAAAALREEVG